MNWEVVYLPEAEKDLKKLDRSQRELIFKAIKKVSKNPISTHEGGFGKTLGNKNGTNLAGFYKIKLLKAGLRVVYKLMQQEDGVMLIIVVGAREDDEVYDIAEKRRIKYDFD